MVREMKILVVDDDLDLLAAQARLLRLEGYQILEASSGREALTLAREHLPDLILMDVVMPEMDGIQVCQKIKNDPLLKWIFVVLLSSLQKTSNEKAHGLESGADGYISRPLPPRELLARVQALLRIKRAEDALRVALAEKELLLHEIHHRVKNSLEVVIALADLQRSRISDPLAQQSLLELQERVRTVALVHESLYRSESVTCVPAQPFLKKLTDSLVIVFGLQAINLQLDIQDLNLDTKQATPLGLIVNELVTNSCKYAFPKDLEPRASAAHGQDRIIRVSLHRQDDLTVLVVGDNGVGLPENFDWRNAKSLGLRLVYRLSQQLHGKLDIFNDQGMYVRLAF